MSSQNLSFENSINSDVVAARILPEYIQLTSLLLKRDVLQRSCSNFRRLYQIDCKVLEIWTFINQFNSQSESDCSESKSHYDCLETGCLTSGNLCNHLAIQCGG